MKENEFSPIAKSSPESPVHQIHDRRPVLWNRTWIAGRWFLLVFLGCFVVCINICCFYLLIKYNPEDIFYGVLCMLLLNISCGGVLVGQARELVEDSKTVNDVPWWCYGCRSPSPLKLNSQ
ncbi:hypothetical protein DCAR_0933475 [Daucus carota subsp. sativus]|uniref:Uncharacterized protein n=1 Tax=Daucus carota subsp. sativus TaxID=79200 RepID=A0A175YDY8_DAUCS|nr:hypothetical protein DCAR_0933475 [Daucus carota subsp. sativus]